MTQAPPELEFSAKYDKSHARAYYQKHHVGFWRGLSDWREQRIARKALVLAGNSRSVLDVPCGTGRFWSLLVEDPARGLAACDYSQEMIATGLAERPSEITSRINTFQASAFNLPVDDDYIECVFCLRLFHHIGTAGDRLRLLSELRRVAAKSMIVSLWVDGNYKAWRRSRLEQKRGERAYQNRFVIPRFVIEHEFSQSGLSVIAKLDFIKFYAQWRTYVLAVE